MIVVDTTVLIYAVGGEHPLREPCRRLVQAITAREVEASTTVEVIQEFAHVRARRRGRVEAAALASEWIDLFAPLVEVTEPALRSGLRLFADHERLGAFDAVLVAAAASPSATALVSADRAFAAVAGLNHVHPDAAGVAALLG